MKKGLLILFSLLVVTSMFAFTQGAMLVGGTAGLSIEKDNSDDDPATRISLYPQLGYFVIDKLCADLIVKVETMSQDEDTETTLGAGIGGRYFFDNLYAGLDFLYQQKSSDKEFVGKHKETAMYGTLKGGYLFPISSKTFVDLRGQYMMGLGDYGADRSGKNESSLFGFVAGLQILLGN
ncbi:MAG: hypothetical protein PHU99_04030 [Candidatus Cloacimonetes bacterium]|jgi:hypothetical protein|nr:hypothetical protein [Candidatus Cloacimonadota bacterium]MDY0337141.1 hypothetical protein [Candidatus Cloacimonadaceae bacterium]MCK9334582.1 hypothetical protein [Candidatus Cloacimonadota bacterium]MDD2544128.1 hypothetical protein [Candidatus Cloacimonadota bacterium]MDD2683001.1 hypothetical protein [Candidatus Cloacimonadota bacterium]